jgi:hypothetical protein
MAAVIRGMMDEVPMALIKTAGAEGIGTVALDNYG